MSLLKKNFGIMQNGKSVDIFTIKNNTGIELSFTNYGGRVTSILVPNKYGKFENIVLGYNNLENYINDKYYLGAIVGRFANRIAKGKFILDRQEYQLLLNNGINHIHGGLRGFDKVVWKAIEIVKDNNKGIKLSYSSPDCEEGYPGLLNVEVTYLLTEENKFIIQYEATTNKPTHINLTHHGYFNLSGDFSKPILNHELKLNSSTFLEPDKESIPTGNILKSHLTALDFQNFEIIGKRINEKNQHLTNGNGYDHCIILKNNSERLKSGAELFEPESGRVMELYTTEPALQFYTGNYLQENKTNGKFGKRTGLCLETQHYPDSPNHPEFPSTILRPGEVFNSQTIYKFKTI